MGNFTRSAESFHPDAGRGPEAESSYPLKKWPVTRRSPLDSLWHENCFLSVLYTDDGLDGREAEVESDRVEADCLIAFPGSDGASMRQTRGLPFQPVLTGTGPERKEPPMARILLVDDDPDMRLIYSTVLSHNGHDVVEAASGSEALATVEEGAVDLVILDVKLGAESGLMVLQRLATTFPHLPVILLTAYASFQDDFASWLADRYLLKSSDFDVFLNEVEQVLRHRTTPPSHRQGVEEHLHP